MASLALAVGVAMPAALCALQALVDVVLFRGRFSLELISFLRLFPHTVNFDAVAKSFHRGSGFSFL